MDDVWQDGMTLEEHDMAGELWEFDEDAFEDWDPATEAGPSVVLVLRTHSLTVERCPEDPDADCWMNVAHECFALSGPRAGRTFDVLEYPGSPWGEADHWMRGSEPDRRRLGA